MVREELWLLNVSDLIPNRLSPLNNSLYPNCDKKDTMIIRNGERYVQRRLTHKICSINSRNIL